MTREQIIETMAIAIHDETWGPHAWLIEHEQQATAALSALEAAGLVVVPVEPTEAMVDAAIIADRPALGRITVGDVLKAEYAAMIKAALNPERDSSG